MNAYAPGPWHIRLDGHQIWNGIGSVAELLCAGYEVKATDNLIAAAPELLVALKSIVEGPAFPDPDHTAAARAAIAKAEGRT